MTFMANHFQRSVRLSNGVDGWHKCSSKGRQYIAVVIFALVALIINPSALAGTCPTAASYGVTANATLTSLGVTSCFYIAANGADTNTGADEAHPWLHAPGMPNCANNCASHTKAAGEGYIFKGGDTWHLGNSGASPYTGGTWVWDQNGTSPNPIYFGVDVLWYTGGSWDRPLFNADNPLSTSTTQSSCTYQVGTNNNIFDLLGINYTILDRLEVLGLCQQTINSPTGKDIYLRYGARTTLLGIYLHGWTHIQFDPRIAGQCLNDIGHCPNTILLQGGGSPVAGDTVGSVYRRVVIDGADSDTSGAYTCPNCDFYDVSYSVLTNSAQIIATFLHTVHDNLLDGWHSRGIHPNMLEVNSEFNGTNAIYNNVFRNVATDVTDTLPQEGIWPIPCASSGVPFAFCTAAQTDYIFNNVFYNVGVGSVGVQMLVIGQNGFAQGSLSIFNNTLEYSINGVIANCDSVSSHPWNDANNLYITDNGTQYSTPCTGKTSTTNLLKTHAQATAGGYTSAQTYAYSPTSGASFTVGAGTNKAAYCTALTSAGLTDAGTACLSSTSRGPTYNSTTHTVSETPILTPVVRGATWDVGADQINGGTPAPTCTLSASPLVIKAGATSTLTFTPANTPTDCSIDHGVGSVSCAGATPSVSPTLATTYTATVTNAGGSNTCSATVTIGGVKKTANTIQTANTIMQ
jgi:hypothetical protein